MIDTNDQKYELLYFTQIMLAEDEINKIRQQTAKIINDHHGKITADQTIGKKKLAYTVKNARHGYFILTNFEAPTASIASINQKIKIIPEILRHKIIIDKQIKAIPVPDHKQSITPRDGQSDQITESAKSKPSKVDLAELNLKIDKLLSDKEDNL